MRVNFMLEALRKEIDSIDQQILDLIQKRISLMKQIGDEKKREAKPIRDAQREQEKIEQIEHRAKLLKIPVTLVTTIWKLFFKISEEVEK